MYLTEQEAQERYDARLPIAVWGVDESGEDVLIDVWEDASTTTRTQAIQQAGDLMDSMLYNGVKSSPTQPHAFPRNGDSDMPEEALKACFELTLALMREKLIHDNAESWQARATYFNASRVESLIADARESLSMREQDVVSAASSPYLKRWLKGRFRSVDYA